jgi:uncharacterized protein (DUF305 family)
MSKGLVGQRVWIVVALVVALVIGAGVGLMVENGDQGTDAKTSESATDVDIGFAQDMSAHHQQALMMCGLVPSSARPDVRGLANQLEQSQWKEIGQMQGWLQMLDAPLQGDHPMSWMGASGGHDHGTATRSMPGSPTGDELTRLSSTTDVEGEILFLQLMIRHHQGAVDMAGEASRTAGDPAVRRAAVGMVKNQSEEISVMTVMLNQRGGQALPYPV